MCLYVSNLFTVLAHYTYNMVHNCLNYNILYKLFEKDERLSFTFLAEVCAGTMYESPWGS